MNRHATNRVRSLEDRAHELERAACSERELRRQQAMEPFESFLIMTPAYRTALRALHDAQWRRGPETQVNECMTSVANLRRDLWTQFESQQPDAAARILEIGGPH